MPACHGDPGTAAFNNVTPYLIRGRPAAPHPTQGGTTTLFKNQRPGAALRECPGPFANRMGIPFQRLGYRPRRPALRQQPHCVPPFSFSWRRRSVHPPPHLRLVHAPPTQQHSHLLHAQQQPPLRFPDPFRPSQPPLSYPNRLRVSPWLWFRGNRCRGIALGSLQAEPQIPAHSMGMVQEGAVQRQKQNQEQREPRQSRAGPLTGLVTNVRA